MKSGCRPVLSLALKTARRYLGIIARFGNLALRGSTQMISKTWRHVSLTLLVAHLMACGGGGGGSGAGADGSGGSAGGSPSRASFTADYAPLNTGDRRLFAVTAGSASGSTTSETIGAQASVGAYSAFETRDEAGDLSYLARTPTSLVAIPGPRSDSLAIALGPVDVLRFGLSAGDSAALFERTVSVDVDGDGRTDTVNLRADFTVVAFESLALPLGSFPNTARTRTVLRTSIIFGAGGSGSLTLTTEDWYAPGVGLVRSQTSTQVAGQPTTTESSEILAYGVASQRSESVAPRLQSVTPADGSAGAPPALVLLRFSERVDHATLLAPNGVRLLDSAGNSVAVTLTATDLGSSTQASLQPTSTLADGRYTVRVAGSVLDWANNGVLAGDTSFNVDTRGPRLTSSIPAADSQDAALIGNVALVFDESVLAADSAGVFIEIVDLTGQSPTQRLAASVNGNTVQAAIASPLVRNRGHEIRLVGNLRDAAGNVFLASSLRLAFRTDPGPLGRPTALVADAKVSALRVADFNQDGRADLLFVADESTTGLPFLGLRAGLAGGGFGPVQRLTNLGPAGTCPSQQLVAGDFDGDGRPDVALACASFLRVYLQTAPGVFTLERPGFNGSSGFGSADFNGDGRSDLALVGTAPGVDVGSQKAWYVITRSSNGTWSALASLAIGGDSAAALASVVGDIDNDGRPDLVWLRSYFDGRVELAWARSQGTGLAATQSQTLAVASASGGLADIALGDIDGDGRTDVLLTLSAPSGRLLVLRGQAAGGFALTQDLPSALAPFGLTLGDIDGNGRLDVIVNHAYERQVGVYLQSASGSLEAERLFETGTAQALDGRSIAVADVTGDGRPDLLAAGDLLPGRPFNQAWPSAVVPATPAAPAMRAAARPGLLGGLVARTTQALVPTRDRGIASTQ
jgi:methionine-rich copper-binding protein CopC